MPTKKNLDKLMRDVAKVKMQVEKIGNNVGSLLAKVKKNYANLDPATKKKIAAGIAGLGAVLAARHVYRKAKKRRKSQS